MRTCSKCGAEKPAGGFSGRRCRDCVAAYKRAHYEANRERYIARATEWNRAHPERHQELARDWVERNPDVRREVTARSSARPEARARRRETAARWRKANPDRMRLYDWRSSERRRNGFRVGPLAGWAEVLRADPCCYCGGPAGEIDHIVPVDAGGVADAGNITSACRSCNAKKYTRSLLTYLMVA